jgi:hypothetical protein
MRFGQLVRRVRKILHEESPYRWTHAQVIAIAERQRGAFGVPEKFRREIVLRVAAEIASHEQSTGERKNG